MEYDMMMEMEDHFSPKENVMVCFKSGCKLRATGQLCAVSSIHFLSYWLYCSPNLNLHTIYEILLGFDCIIFWSSHVALSMLIFLVFPTMAIVVNAHSASETAHISVGENFYPLPWLSVGASLYIWVPLCKCMA